jgi:hypothetical protein
MSDFPERVSAAEACRRIGISRRTLGEWISAGCPHERDADNRLRLDVPEVERWRDGLAAGTDAAFSYSESRARKEHFVGKLRELEFAQRQGDLIPFAEVCEELARTFYDLRTRLNSLLPAVRQRLGDVAADVVDRELRTALETLRSQWVAETPEEAGNGA